MSQVENLTFVAIMVATFSVAERAAWGSTFAKADRAGWIDHDLKQEVMHR